MPQIIREPRKWQQLCDMAKNRNALATNITKSPEKHKHSVPFYISPSLFDNKRLKQKRAKWASACRQLSTVDHDAQHRANTKTDYIGRRAALEPAVTIDLLSDDDDEHYAQNNELNEKTFGKVIMPGPPPLAPIQGLQLQPNVNGHPLQHFLVYPGNIPGIQLTNASNIRLIPLSQLSLDALQQQTLELEQKLKNDEQQQKQKPIHTQLQQQHQHQQQQQQHQPQQSKPLPQSKRKRKSHQPKRHSQPTIVNNESIVLTDDSDTETHAIETARSKHHSSPVAPATAIAVPTIVHGASIAKHKDNAIMQTQKITSTPTPPITQPPPPQPAPPPPAVSPVRIAQVDEEVTVSLVPRSSTGSCSSKTANSKLFPMQPDETTVHTVIANRIYELSLTKLREGLGIDCEPNGQSKSSPTRKGKGKAANGPSPIAGSSDTQQEHVSLKLSSDLSISLISDDEEDDDDDIRQQFNPDKLQLPPHLAVHQVHLPAAATAADTGQLPRRRKLG